MDRDTSKDRLCRDVYVLRCNVDAYDENLVYVIC